MWGWASFRERLSWCVRHTVGSGGWWWRAWKTQGSFPGLLYLQETSEVKQIAVHQCGVAQEVETLCTRVGVMVKTRNSKDMYNTIHCDPVHVVGDPSDPWHVLNA